MKVTLNEITEDAERKIIHIARVSNPKNQDNPEISKLIKYCIDHKHWSIFEHAHMTIEVETSLAVATQIIRHHSFRFQQFSQRYSNGGSLGFETITLRKQSEKNRQSSVEMIDPEKEIELISEWEDLLVQIQELYNKMIEAGVAKECARFILPQCTTTRLYMTGDIRSWIHYLQVRSEDDVQDEHRKIAVLARKIFSRELPLTSIALGWLNEKGEISAD